VIALAGVGVFAAGGTLSLFSRDSLLTLDADLREARTAVASVTAASIARALTSDLQTLEGFAAAPRVQTAAVSERGLRLADAVCDVRRDGSARCAPDAAAAWLRIGDVAAPIQASVRSRRPVVSPFIRTSDGYLAVAAVPVEDAASPQAATVALIRADGGRLRQLLGPQTALAIEDAASLPAATVPGTAWTVTFAASGHDDPVGRFRQRSIWISPALAALAVLLATGIAISINRPLLALTRAAERMAAGDLSASIDGGPDEIGRFGVSLEHMRVRLRESIAAASRANAELERRVEERTQQLQQLLAKVISAQEDERRRVARELHDETSQLLTALSMAIHAGPAAGSDPRALIARLQDGVHRLIVNLRPAVLDDLGLAAAIDGLADTQLRRAGIAVRCETSELEHTRLAPETEITVFRIVQEAVFNIVRHSAATTVLIQAGMEDGHVWVEIEDDGKGFDPAASHPGGESLRGIGLLGMRERAELLGGTLTIDSAPGAGTRIKAVV
jgi:signal transduction histidine kinase